MRMFFFGLIGQLLVQFETNTANEGDEVLTEEKHSSRKVTKGMYKLLPLFAGFGGNPYDCQV